MARKKKESALNVWVDLIALLPWWGGVDSLMNRLQSKVSSAALVVCVFS